jgi:hypothetical protein
MSVLSFGAVGPASVTWPAGSTPGAEFLPDWLTWHSGGTSTLEGITAGAILAAFLVPRFIRWRKARAARRENQDL